MPRIALPMGKQSAKSQAPAESAERLLNGYVESVPTGKEPTPVFGTPGLAEWCAGLSGGCRGAIEMKGGVYAVMGLQLYSFAADGTSTSLGVIPNSDLVGMAGDGTNVVIVTLGAIYVWNGSSLNLVTDPDAPAASSVAWSDGYFIFGILGGEEFAIDALADPTNYDALDFAAAEWRPDDLVTPALLRNTVYMLGKSSIEAQQNVGGADFPFARYDGIFINVGIVGRDAFDASRDTLFWQAPDYTARRLDGLTATVISTRYVSKLMRGWSDQSATVASSHVVADHLFIVFRNPDGCVVYDQSTGLWHERLSYQLGTWRIGQIVECFGLSLAFSAVEGKVYRLDEDSFDEGGETLEFEMVTPYAYQGNQRLTVGEVEAVCQTGVGTLTLDPQLTCEKTRDGETWGPRKARSLGKAGERNKRLLFGPQGQARFMAFRFRITDAVRRAILGVYVDADLEA